MKKIVVLTTLFMLALVSTSLCQITLKGKVVDAKNGKALVGANVRLLGTSIGIATNNKGEFILNRVPEGTYTLRASYSGYEVCSMKINGSKSDILFRLTATPVNLNQVVVTGTGTHRRLKDSPVPVEVITASEMLKAGVSSFEDAMLMLNPSFDIRPTAMGSNITLNGLTNKHILILLNGKKMIGDISGNIDLSRIDIKRIKRIEILKGAASSLYGSDAIGGVINIITDQPHDKLNIMSSTRFGGNNSFIQNVIADINTEKFSSSTTYQRRQGDGWQLSDINEDSTATRKRVSDDFHSNLVSQRFTVDPNKNLSIYAEGSYFDKKISRPVNESAKDKTAFNYDITYEDYTVGVGGKYLLGNASYISLDVNMANYEYSYLYTFDTKPYVAGDEILTKRQRYLNGNLRGVFKVGKYNKVTVGTEYLSDYLKNKESLEKPESTYTLSLYAQDEIRVLKNLQLLPGFRYVYHETFKGYFTPKLAVMYTLGSFNFRASYAAGFKTPRLEDLFYFKEKSNKLTVGNKDLKPEKSNYYSLNAEYTGKYLNLSVNGYINNVKDIINSVSVEMTPEEEELYTAKNQYVNIAKARLQGVDVNLNSYLGAGFSVGGGYSYLDAKDRTTHTRLKGSVRHTGTVRAGWMHDWDFYRLNVNLNGRVQGKKYFYSENTKTGEITDESAVKYNIWNLTTNHHFAPVGKFLFEVNAGIENLFDFTDDRPYGVNYASISPGRTYFASLIIRFKL